MDNQPQQTDLSPATDAQTIRQVGARARTNGIDLLVIYVGAEIRVFLTDKQAENLIASIQAAMGEAAANLGEPN